MSKFKENIKVEGQRGTWYELDRATYYGETLYLMESEIYGDEAPCIIINEHNNVIAQYVYNGFSDLDERIEYIKNGDTGEDTDRALMKLMGIN